MSKALPVVSAPTQIIAAGALVKNGLGHVLLVLSARGEWEFPGGQIENGEMLTNGLRREVLEETGIEIEVIKLVSINSNLKNLPIINFDFTCGLLGGAIRTSVESVNVEWVMPDRALEMITRPVIRDRLRIMLNFRGEVIYRAYKTDTNRTDPDYQIYHERYI